MAASSETFPWAQICSATQGSFHVEDDESSASSSTVVDTTPSLDKIQEAFAQFIHQMRAWLDQHQKPGQAAVAVDTGYQVKERDGKPSVTFKVKLLPRSPEELSKLATVGGRVYEAGRLNCHTQAERFLESLKQAFYTGAIRADDAASFNINVTKLLTCEYQGSVSQPRLLLQPQGEAYSLGIYAPEFRDDEMADLLSTLLDSGLPVIRIDLSSCEEIHGNCLAALAKQEKIHFLRLADCGKLRVSCLKRELAKTHVAVLELEGGGREYLRLAKDQLKADYVLGIKYANGGLYSNYRDKFDSFCSDVSKLGLSEQLINKHRPALMASSKLSLARLETALAEVIEGIHALFPHLLELDLSDILELSDKALNALAKANPQVHTLVFHNSAQITAEGIFALVDKMPSLRRIQIKRCKGIKFRSLKKQLDRLEETGRQLQLYLTCDGDSWKSKDPFLPF